MQSASNIKDVPAYENTSSPAQFARGMFASSLGGIALGVLSATFLEVKTAADLMLVSSFFGSGTAGALASGVVGHFGKLSPHQILSTFHDPMCDSSGHQPNNASRWFGRLAGASLIGLAAMGTFNYILSHMELATPKQAADAVFMKPKILHPQNLTHPVYVIPTGQKPKTPVMI